MSEWENDRSERSQRRNFKERTEVTCFFFFSEHCGYQVLTVKLFANYVHFSVFFSVFGSSAGFLLFPLNLTRKQPKVCMFYLFLFLQNNLLTSTELNSIYSDFTDHSVAGCGTSSASPPRSWETSCTVQSTAVSRDMTEGVLVVWLVSRSRIDVRVNVSVL